MRGKGKTLAYLEDEDEGYWDEEAEDYADYGAYEAAAPAQEAAFETDEPKGGDVAQTDEVCEDLCAICLSLIEPVELAIVKGCNHEYCVNCILQWAVCKETPWCPQCKKPFSYLYTHRQLDGTLSDAPMEESVCLLKRATWFVDHVKALNGGQAVSAAMAADDFPHEWVDQYDEDYRYDDDEDEQIENYYFSTAAGTARVVLGNRRLGENGFQRSGRMFARPTNNHNQQASQAAASGDAIGKAGKGRTPANKAAAGAGATGAGGSSAGPSGASAAAAGGSQGQGRRAKRNARRAAAEFSDLAI